jgi:hypothetical protein
MEFLFFFSTPVHFATVGAVVVVAVGAVGAIAVGIVGAVAVFVWQGCQ